MRTLTYYTLDVFTQTAFTGNPLAVFVDAQGLSDQQMQQIAREMNLSETVFITEKAGDAAWSVRIFMPQGEIPFAGHPTVGTAVLLDYLEWLPEGADKLVLNEQVGPVPIVIERGAGSVKATLRSAVTPAYKASHLTAQSVSEMVGLASDAVVGEPWIGNSGVPYQLVQLSNSQQLESVQLDLAAWRVHLGADAVPDLCLFVADKANQTIHMRMFCPACGVLEDPATGSAAAALVGSLALRNGWFGTWQIAQGAEIGRPSLIEAGTERIGQESIVSVGGHAVVVARGELMLPT